MKLQTLIAKLFIRKLEDPLKMAEVNSLIVFLCLSCFSPFPSGSSHFSFHLRLFLISSFLNCTLKLYFYLLSCLFSYLFLLSYLSYPPALRHPLVLSCPLLPPLPSPSIFSPFLLFPGVEVDIKTEPLIPGPAETIFLTQGTYEENLWSFFWKSEFIGFYLSHEKYGMRGRCF